MRNDKGAIHRPRRRFNGPGVVSGLRYVCSDMWRAYFKVIAAKAPQALHVLDRFHITMHLNQAVDQVRRAETGRLRGRPIAEKLKHMRWKLLRRGSRVRGQAKQRLWGLLRTKLGRCLSGRVVLPGYAQPH